MTTTWNTSAFLDLNTAAQALPDALWANITVLGDSLVALALVNLVALRYPRAMPATLIAGIIATVITRSLKSGLGLERPLAVLGQQVHVIGIDLHNFSFPSGHTTTAFLLAGICALAWQRKPLSAVFFSLAALVGFSRIAVGAHWPQDVFAGAVFGYAAAWLGWQFALRWQWANSRLGQRILSGLFLVFALLVFKLDTGYPQAIVLQMSLAFISTLAALYTLWQTGRNP